MTPLDEDARAALIVSRLIDDEPVGLDPDLFECALHDYHSPLPRTLERHHVIPISWTQELGRRPSRTIPACPTGHDALHYWIRLRVAGGEIDDREIDEKLRPYIEEAVTFWHANGLAGRDVRAGLVSNERRSRMAEEKTNRGRDEEARDPNRPTFTDPETGEVEKEGLGRRAPETPDEPEPNPTEA